ncbi:MAG: hypothetical protein COA54_06145 [Thiotrichaceae bacterium]|nr:MAG: hypothetical protein COA54_06145 [Thiotrichaceae bacterium]
MWPFIKQKKHFINDSLLEFSEDEPEPRRALTLEQLVDGIEDCSDLSKNDVALKFWLPEPAKQGLKELSDIYDKTISRYLRDFLLIHCYGVYAFEWMRENEIFRIGEMPMFMRSFDKSSESPSSKVRVSTYFVPELGKNITPMKLWIPTRLKNDLTLLAKHVDLTTSNYVREIVISRLLGHGTLPMRPKMLEFTPTSITENWNDNQDVPWREIQEDELQHYEVYEVNTEIIDREK